MPQLHLVEIDETPATILDGPSNIRHAQTLGYPVVRILPQNTRKCVIVGGGRSILKFERELGALYDSGAYFLSINKVHDWLIEHGMPPHGHMVFEVGPIMDELDLSLQPDTEYFVGSLCHPGTFDALKGYDVKIWHPQTRDPECDMVMDRGSHVIAGGGTTFGRSIPLMLVLGYRAFEIFGAESSYEWDGDSHFNGTPHYLGGKLPVKAVTTTGETREFMSAPYLAMQANDVREIMKRYHFMFRCRFHGDGLLPWLHRTMFPEQYQEA